MICNAKESDPGAFTDRSILESDPHKLIEGLAIGSYAIGASNAIIFIRSGSDHARNRLQKAKTRQGNTGLSDTISFQAATISKSVSK
jgi:bidirectional [NiFe] hydrogenase diaphorase subunit